MKARLLVERPCYANEWTSPRILKAGTIVTITGCNNDGLMTAKRVLGVLTVNEDQIEPLDK